MFNQITLTRNSLMHFIPFNEIKAQTAFLQMIQIAEYFQMDELKESLINLRKNTIKEETITTIQKEESNKKINISSENPKRSKRKQQPNKKKVINVISNTKGIYVNKSYTNLSTINSNNIYSVEPNFIRKDNDWYLLLINTVKRTIYVFKIPSNDNVYSKLDQRVDKKVYRLTFDIDDLTFRDKVSDVKFDNFLKVKCKYDTDSLIFK